MKLGIGSFERRLRIGRALQFPHRQGQAVDKDSDVSAHRLALALHDELVGDQEPVGTWVRAVKEAEPDRAPLSVLGDLNRNARSQQRVKGAVVFDEILAWRR